MKADTIVNLATSTKKQIFDRLLEYEKALRAAREELVALRTSEVGVVRAELIQVQKELKKANAEISGLEDEVAVLEAKLEAVDDTDAPILRDFLARIGVSEHDLQIAFGGHANPLEVLKQLGGQRGF